MRIYYFHLIENGERFADRDGSSFASFELAYLATHRAVQDMWWEMVKRGKDPRNCSFEITDSEGSSLAFVPFTEPLDDVVHPVAPTDDGDVDGNPDPAGVPPQALTLSDPSDPELGRPELALSRVLLTPRTMLGPSRP